MKKPRVPRKLKKELKKDPYFKLFGRMWINNLKWKTVEKEIKKFWWFNIGTLQNGIQTERNI